ncbi:MAG: M28 family peptidase [Gammaproteobacteria bacterium]|nr:M28 family peptidase [Gammaproteobacteria bacterium]
MNKNYWLAVVLVTGLLTACNRQAADSTENDAGESENAPGRSGPTVEQAARMINGDFMRQIVAEISDDRYEGRGPGSRGDQAARAYLAEQMAAMGLQPGATDGSWQQTFELVGMSTVPPDDWTFGGAGKSLTLKNWDDFLVESGVQEPRASVKDAELVFVGYGIQAPEFDWDDFKGVDLAGKILLIMNNDPDWDPALFGGETRLWYGRWDYKYLQAAMQGAAGALIIHTTRSAGYPFKVLQSSGSGAQFELPAADEPRTAIRGWLTEKAAAELVSLAGFDLDTLRDSARKRSFTPVALGVTTSIDMAVELERTESANVLGLLPGSGAGSSDEVVIYTAHHDHLGIGAANEDGDIIYNGARDNATGVAQVLAIAGAFTSMPVAPRRSILFALVGAEEQGLLGSEFYAANPTFSPGKIAATVNLDSANIWGRSRDVTFVGLGKSSVDEYVIQIAADQGRVVTPDQFPDKGYFYRSDQFNLARIGVPAVYLKAGIDFVGRAPDWGRLQQEQNTAVDYHQPSDEYDPAWNFDGMVDDAVLGFLTGLAIAAADEMPAWVPGDEFEAARFDALAALDANGE